MTATAEYDMHVQAKIPAALAALHNFICTFDPDDLADEQTMDSVNNESLPPVIPFNPQNLGTHIDAAESQCASDKHDQIAKDMWEDYVTEQQCRGI